jgi:hypothetical protein
VHVQFTPVPADQVVEVLSHAGSQYPRTPPAGFPARGPMSLPVRHVCMDAEFTWITSSR